MREWIEFLGSYPAWVKGFVALSIAINAILLIVFSPKKKDSPIEKTPSTINYTGKVTDANNFTNIRGAKVSLEYQGINKVIYTDAEGFFAFSLEVKDFPLSASIRVEQDGYTGVDRNIQINKINQSERIQLSPTPTPTPPPTSTPTSNFEDKESKGVIKKIVQGCNRRSVFTKMHAQINLEAMYKSLAECRAIVQTNQPLVKPRGLSQITANMIAALDAIERYQETPPQDHEKFNKEIDQLKLRIIRGLNDLSKSIKLEFTLPPNLTDDFFFTKEEADKAPGSPH